MQILHIIPSYKPAYIYGGPIVSSSMLCESQAKLGHEVLVYTTLANGKSELDFIANIVHVVEGVNVRYFKRLTKDHSHFSPALLFAVWKSCKKQDVVHIHSWWNTVAILSVLICWLRGVRPVLSPRGMLSNYTQSTRHSMIKKVIGGFGGTFLLKKTLLHATAQQEAIEGLLLNKNWQYFIAPNIVPLPHKALFQKHNHNNVLNLIFLARIDQKKGLELLFEALSLVKRDWNLQLFGSGDEHYIKTLKALAKQLNIEQNIQWRGWVAKEQKYDELKKADLFVLTSKNENFANAALEACAVGTPVLLSDQVGFSEWVTKFNLGWVVALNKVKISEVIVSIDKNIMYLNATDIIEKIYTEFDPQFIAQQYVEYYQKLLK